MHSNVFYNGTVEVVEPSGILSGENAFLALLALALLSLLGYWAYTQVQKLTKVRSPPAPQMLIPLRHWWGLQLSGAPCPRPSCLHAAGSGLEPFVGSGHACVVRTLDGSVIQV